MSALQLAASGPGQVYNARDGQTSVHAPSSDATIKLDGVLDEPVWQSAALLTGFSEYQPVDSRPAADSTEVLVWYSRDAIYFGIRAMEPHGAVRATLADRDKVDSDDNVEIQLDTYDERNRAFVFIVNPLGVQADGTRTEGSFNYQPGAHFMYGGNDLSADYLWDSKGHVTDWGYEVEVRIPFSSLRYPTKAVQNWGIQIQRNVQHSGYQDTWTPAVRAAASFIDQEGLLVGLTGMHHGQVVQLNPEATNTLRGEPRSDAEGWSYGSESQLGGNVRWMAGSNFVLNGTVKPDFSQVEADATQIAADERFALSYPEKRPFFVEGADQFTAPNSLVYTRAIVHPDAAVKLTGKVGRTDVAVLSALDHPSTALDGGRRRVDIVRLRRGFAAQSTAGLLYSERVGGGRSNRVFDADVHHVFGGMYYAELQGVMSRTTQDGTTTSAPMWEATVDRTGRSFGFHYTLQGIGTDFAADNGFVRRTGIVQPSISNRFSAYGGRGALMERYNLMLRQAGVWRYEDFFAGKSLLEDQFSASNELTLRGGWSIRVDPTLASYAFDPADYSRLFTGTAAQPVAFVPSDRITTFTTQVSVSTPQFSTFSASLGMTAGDDVDFLETSRVRRLDYNASLDARPTQQIRIGATYRSTSFHRGSDDVRTASTRIPRVKVEYQVSRSVFLRVVAQYTATEREPLRDPRTGEILVVQGVDGSLAPSTRTESNQLRADWLFSYRPSPGTVVFLGYGNTLTEPNPLGLRQLRPVNDAFFVKVSYLFRALGAR
ncbi:MAG: carbohydrate binding family 9 domain-containing protein [Gemmatimonadetes bacterium]|nr:carbohydrate binding family 9 domain-containing protein [Gemmatimonadota bacterium]